MEVSNRSLVLLLGVTLALLAGAIVLSIDLSTLDDGPLQPGPDVLQLMPEVRRSGAVVLDHEGPLLVNVRVDDGQPAPTTALLQCESYKSERPVDPARSLVWYTSVPIGNCTLRLFESDAPYGPVYPGDELECRSLNGFTDCTGGQALEHAGVLSVTSATGGALALDGVELGPVPVSGIDAPVGRHVVEVTLDDGRVLMWNLIVHPDEEIHMRFPDPDA